MNDRYTAKFFGFHHLGNSSKLNPFSDYVFYNKWASSEKRKFTFFMPFLPDGATHIFKYFKYSIKWAYFRV